MQDKWQFPKGCDHMRGVRTIPEGHHLTITFVEALDHAEFQAVRPGCVGMVPVHVEAKGNTIGSLHIDYGINPADSSVIYDAAELGAEGYTRAMDAPDWCSPQTVGTIGDGLHL